MRWSRRRSSELVNLKWQSHSLRAVAKDNPRYEPYVGGEFHCFQVGRLQLTNFQSLLDLFVSVKSLLEVIHRLGESTESIGASESLPVEVFSALNELAAVPHAPLAGQQAMSLSWISQ